MSSVRLILTSVVPVENSLYWKRLISYPSNGIIIDCWEKTIWKLSSSLEGKIKKSMKEIG